MRVLAAVVTIALAASTAAADVWVEVYRHDGVTPLAPIDPNYPDVYRDIMVGTHLVLVVKSNAGGPWYGSLEMSPEDWNFGTLEGRGHNPETGTYDDSALPASGSKHHGTPSDSRVVYFEGPVLDGYRAGFDLNANFASVPGEWFVLDYFAEQVGPCHVLFYDLLADFDNPQDVLSFNHVLSRDFNTDTIVDFEDFARLASHWGSTTDGVDFDLEPDGQVGWGDLAAFGEYWLERTDTPPDTDDGM